MEYQCICTQAVACHNPGQSVRYHGNFDIKNSPIFLNSLLFSQGIRGLLEKYQTFGREEETGLLGALDT